MCVLVRCRRYHLDIFYTRALCDGHRDMDPPRILVTSVALSFLPPGKFLLLHSCAFSASWAASQGKKSLRTILGDLKIHCHHSLSHPLVTHLGPLVVSYLPVLDRSLFLSRVGLLAPVWL